MSNKKVYWKGFEELEETPSFVKQRDNEFAQDVPLNEFLADEESVSVTTNRRDFLKFLGFSLTAATLAACETPIQKAIPYVIKPERITPGVTNYYASSYYDGSDFASIMVRSREGRPIKIDGNFSNPVTKGGTNARIQASVLNLYDSKREKSAMKAGAPIAWSEADSEIIAKLEQLAAKGSKVVLLTNTIISPSTKAVIADLKAKYANVEHVQQDSISYNAIRVANEQSFGKAVIPSYQFDKANAIVSFGADFLNSWLMSGVYEGQYAKTRKPDHGEMSRHFQFEANMSLAGSNADYRYMIKQSEIGLGLVALHNYLAGKLGAAKLAGGEVSFAADIEFVGDYLIANKGKSLVVCGLNDVNAQLITNKINEMLGSYGTTIDLSSPVHLFQGDDKAVNAVMNDILNNKIGGLICYNTNPVYTSGNNEALKAAIKGLELSVSFADRVEETETTYLLPDHNYLESWNDFNPVGAEYSLQQPTIHPLFDSRSAQETLLVWAGLAKRTDKNSTVYRDYIKTNWEKTIYTSSSAGNFVDFWNNSLYNGYYTGAKASETTSVSMAESVSLDAAAKALAEKAASSKGWEVVLYEKVGIGDGTLANNPILQELPDPISRVTWDNYITMAPEDMDKPEFGFNKLFGEQEWAHVAKITVNGTEISLPVLAQPGQAPGTVGIAVGYGRKFGKTDEVIGKNAFGLVTFENGNYSTFVLNAELVKAGEKYQLAGTQTHHTMMARDIVKESSLKEFQKNHKAGNPDKRMHTNVATLVAEGEHDAPVDKIDYWRPFKMINHRWGLSIDLNSCTGCGACVVSCHIENNVPVVGKDEVRRSRDMHWLRIDRYYTSDADPKERYTEANSANKNARAKEIPGRNPRVAFQPVMCQHCNHAPCETVCPVIATSHSTEGLNQMTYNRCVGTRYCANNCPYKVRRFNWFNYADNAKFDYYMNDDLGKMVLNPDVTVRGRGVMEKCSMCVQRIQAGKLEAKKAGHAVIDGDIQTACSDACPTNAIVFGDFNDTSSELAKNSNNPRAYYLLEEVGVKPNVVYQTKIRNVEEEYGNAVEVEHHAAGHGAHDAGHDSHESHDAHAH